MVQASIHSNGREGSERKHINARRRGSEDTCKKKGSIYFYLAWENIPLLLRLLLPGVLITQWGVVAIATVERCVGVRDRYIGIERTKATLSRSRNINGYILIHGGLEGNLETTWVEKSNTSRQLHFHALMQYLILLSIGVPESAFTLLFRDIIFSHKHFILLKLSSSTWYISLAAQQQPRWRLKGQSQSHLLQVRDMSHLTAKTGKSRSVSVSWHLSSCFHHWCVRFDQIFFQCIKMYHLVKTKTRSNHVINNFTKKFKFN